VKTHGLYEVVNPNQLRECSWCIVVGEAKDTWPTTQFNMVLSNSGAVSVYKEVDGEDIIVCAYKDWTQVRLVRQSTFRGAAGRSDITPVINPICLSHEEAMAWGD